MPTAKPRVQVTLTTPQYELLKRLAKLQRRSASAVVAEMFEQVYPVLERVAVVLQAAARAQESAKDGLRLSTEQAERDLRPVVAQALGQLDLLTAEFERGAEPAERPAAGRPRPSNPRLVTRGSGMREPPPRNTPSRRPRRAKSTKRRPKR